MMLKRTPPKRTFKTFPGHAPEVDIIKTSIFRNRIRARQGMEEVRTRRRTKEDKRDRMEFRQVPLPRSVIDKIAADLRIKHADDEPVTDKQWNKLIDGVIAHMVVQKVTRK